MASDRRMNQDAPLLEDRLQPFSERSMSRAEILRSPPERGRIAVEKLATFVLAVDPNDKRAPARARKQRASLFGVAVRL